MSSAGSPATVTVTSTQVVYETITADPTTETPDATYTPTASDFKLSLKILRKACFGSAGCNIDFRVIPSYSGQPVSGTVEVTYEISGADSPYTNTFTMDGSGNATVKETEAVSSDSGKISVKITDVSMQ